MNEKIKEVIVRNLHERDALGKPHIIMDCIKKTEKEVKKNERNIKTAN